MPLRILHKWKFRKFVAHPDNDGLVQAFGITEDDRAFHANFSTSLPLPMWVKRLCVYNVLNSHLEESRKCQRP